MCCKHTNTHTQACSSQSGHHGAYLKASESRIVVSTSVCECDIPLEADAKYTIAMKSK